MSDLKGVFCCIILPMFFVYLFLFWGVFWSLFSQPEITVENLPVYLRLQKPLLILFSDGSINPQYRKAILTLAKQKYLDSLTPCWLNV
jgi:hypothetical protein